MIIRNVKVYTEEMEFVEGEIVLQDGRIEAAPGSGTGEDSGKTLAGEEVLDGGGCYAIPGLIDLHFHGCAGHDICDGTPQALSNIAEHEAANGITSICPATMTLPYEELLQILRNAADWQKNRQEASDCPKGADLLGINMEGPFISIAKKGAQNERYIHPADTPMLQRLQDICGGKIRTAVIAPETEGAMEFIRKNSGSINISLAHTTADYDTCMEAFLNGASQLTHTYNAMPPFTHRAPGPIGAAADADGCMAELICDGVHIHPAVVRATFKLFGDDRIILISDSMRAAGMEDGTYDLGGQEVTVKGSLATLSDGTIAGSVTNLMDCMRTAVKAMGIPLASAVALTSNESGSPSRYLRKSRSCTCRSSTTEPLLSSLWNQSSNPHAASPLILCIVMDFSSPYLPVS